MICYGKKKILMIFSNSPSISFVIILVKVGTKNKKLHADRTI